jgi:hypothetical protein
MDKLEEENKRLKEKIKKLKRDNRRIGELEKLTKEKDVLDLRASK